MLGVAPAETPRREQASDPVAAADRAAPGAGAAQQNLIVPPLSDLANPAYPYAHAAASLRPAARRPRKHAVPNQPDLTAPAAPSVPARLSAPQPEAAAAAAAAAAAETAAPAGADAAVPSVPARLEASQPEVPAEPAEPAAPAGADASPGDAFAPVDLPAADVRPGSPGDAAVPGQPGSPGPEPDLSDQAEEGAAPVDTPEAAPADDPGREQADLSDADGYGPSYTAVDASDAIALPPRPEAKTGERTSPANPVPPPPLIHSRPAHNPQAAASDSRSYAASENSLTALPELPALEHPTGYSFTYTYVSGVSADSAENAPPHAPPELPVHENPTGDSFTYTYVSRASADSAEYAQPHENQPHETRLEEDFDDQCVIDANAYVSSVSAGPAECTLARDTDHAADFDDQGVIDESTLAKIEAMNSMLLSDSKAAKSIDEFWSRVVSGSVGKDDCAELGRRVKAGIPSSYVGAVWKDLAEIRKSTAPDHISLLAGNELYYEGTIDRHLHVIHQSGLSLANPAGLFRVLKAYGIHDRPLGYCPNAAYVVNSLMRHMSEEDAYHMFVMVMKGNGPFRLRDWSTGAGLQVVLFQLDKIMEACIPDIRKHLLGKGVTADLYAIDWITSLFQRQAPTSLGARLLSGYLLEGPAFFFKAAVAALTAVRGDLMRAGTAEELEAALQNPFAHEQAGDHDAFMHAAYALGGISDRVLEQFAVEFEVRRWSRLENLRRLRAQEAEREAAKRAAAREEAEREAAARRAAAREEAEREAAARRAAGDRALESAEKAAARAAAEQRPRSMIIPSGLYSLFSRASRRRSEANAGPPAAEPNAKNRRSSDGEYFPGDHHHAPGDHHHAKAPASNAGTTATTTTTTTQMWTSSSSRLSVASAQSGASTPTSFFAQSPPHASEPAGPAPAPAAGPPAGKRPDETEPEPEPEPALLAAYAAKTAELATELTDAQVAVVRERAAAKALLKQVGELIHANARLEVELEQTRKRAEWSEAARRKLELKFQRLASLVSED